MSQSLGQKKNQRRKTKETARERARFAKSQLSFGELTDERSKWEARLRSWRQSRFWLPLWGPKPTEPGLLRAIIIDDLAAINDGLSGCY